MKACEEFYTTKLYPIQDGILQMMTQLDTPFYLTGGTALSRFYFNHRFSDDLDFFVNNDEKFIAYIKKISAAIKSFCKINDYICDTQKVRISDSFSQFFVEKNMAALKLDFVNDIETRFGELVKTKDNLKIDSLRNILSNKISALFRHETKDIVDIWIITQNYRLNWEQILNEAKEKELGIDPIIVAEIIQSFPKNKLNEIRWIHKFDFEIIAKDLKIIVKDILSGADNSLCKTDVDITKAKPIYFS